MPRKASRPSAPVTHCRRGHSFEGAEYRLRSHPMTGTRFKARLCVACWRIDHGADPLPTTYTAAEADRILAGWTGSAADPYHTALTLPVA